MSPHLLKLEHIRKSYQDGTERNLILNDISFHVEAGEFAAIVGPSGSGKSTLLSISGMMLSPDSGCVYLDGNNMSGLKQREWTKIRMEHIGFIFQKSSASSLPEMPGTADSIPKQEEAGPHFCGGASGGTGDEQLRESLPGADVGRRKAADGDCQGVYQ